MVSAASVDGIDDPAACSHYVLQRLSGIPGGQQQASPLGWQSRLIAAGMRPISHIVDVTNLVLLGLGQPLHAFDADTLQGEIVVRRAQAGEKLTTLDGVERQHARFVQWRRMWDHIVQARAVPGEGSSEVPSAFWTPGWSLHRIDPERCRGVCGLEAEARVGLRQALDERFQQGRPAFPASVLGL